MSRVARRAWRFLLGLVVVLALGYGVLWALYHHAPPSSLTPGPEADALAHAVEQAVNVPAWQRTGAVRFTWDGVGGAHQHLWDKARSLDRVRWGHEEVLLDIAKQDGKAWHDGQLVTDEKTRHKLVDKAYAMWINDTFWLNPLPKLFDDGVTRSIATLDDGRKGLMVSYASGGKTPGDRYLWIPGSDGKPVAWRLWVSVLPIGGFECSWTDWVTLSTGAQVSTEHHGGPLNWHMRDVAGAATLAELSPGADPFAPLVAAVP